MKYAVAASFAVFAGLAASKSAISEENVLQKCVNWYPTRIEWCKQQYPSLAGTLSSTVQAQQDATPPTSQPALVAKEAEVSPAGPVEAITAVSKHSGRTVLFVMIKTVGNVLCADDAPAWVLAERDGNYFAVNGLARSWSPKMRVYRSGKWYPVKDAGIGPDSVFGMEGTRQIINAGNDLCVIGKGSMTDELADRVDAGQDRAIELGSRYGL